MRTDKSPPPARVWQIERGESGIGIWYGGRVTTIDAWLIRCDDRVYGDCLARSSRGSLHHIGPLLNTAAVRLGRPTEIRCFDGSGQRAVRQWAARLRAKPSLTPVILIPAHERQRDDPATLAAIISLQDTLRRLLPASLREARLMAETWTRKFNIGGAAACGGPNKRRSHA